MTIWQSLFPRNGKTKTSGELDGARNTRAIQVDLQGLIQLRYQSTHLSLGSQRKAYSSMSGNYNSPFKGRGLNFDEVRPYQPGDDIRNIDWNVTARTDTVHTKVFKEERERPVFIIVDLNSSMYFGSRHCLKSVTAAKAAALFAWTGADNHNRIGGLVFNQSSHMEIRPKGGHQGVLRFIKLLTDFHNRKGRNNHSNGKKPSTPNSQIQATTNSSLNFEQLFARIQKLIYPGSIVLYVSDFINTNTEMLKYIRRIARHNDFLIAHIYDHLESELPPAGQYGISDGKNYQLLNSAEQSLRNSFHEQFRIKLEGIEQFCMQNQIHLINLATDDNVADRFLATLGKDSTVRRIARSRH